MFFLLCGYQNIYLLLAQKRPNLAQNWHFWPNICIFGPYDPMPDQKTMRTRYLGGFSVMWVPKLLLPPKRIRIFGPKFLSPHFICHFKVFVSVHSRGRGLHAASMKNAAEVWWVRVANLSISPCDESDVGWQCHYFVCGFLPPLLCLPCSILILSGTKTVWTTKLRRSWFEKNSPEHVNIIGLLVFGMGGKHNS